MKKHGKKYKAAAKLVAEKDFFSLTEAIKIIKKTSVTKFDSSVEIHIATRADQKQADQIIRGIVVLPAGTGKTKKVAVFCDESKKAEAKKAGADLIGGEELIDDISKNKKIDFDIAVATPEIMKNLAKIAKILGPKGIMPNPKSGTVTLKIEEAVTEIKKGKVELRADKSGILHMVFGKASFSENDLKKNAQVILEKGNLIKSISISTSMGPGIFVDPAEIK